MTKGGKLVVVVVVVTTTVVWVAGANESCPRVSYCGASCIALIGWTVLFAFSCGCEVTPIKDLDDEGDVDCESEFELEQERFDGPPRAKISEVAPLGRMGGSITGTCYGACYKRLNAGVTQVVQARPERVKIQGEGNPSRIRMGVLHVSEANT